MKYPLTRLGSLFLLGFALNISWAEEKQIPQTKKSENSAKFCKNLKKVNNMEELLYQFYSHFDNDCLLHTPSGVLEKAWGIKIFDIRGSFDNRQLFWDAFEKYYGDTPKQGFNYDVYIRRHNESASKPPDEYFIISSRVDYLDEQKTLLPNNRFPKSLPKPVYSERYCGWICNQSYPFDDLKDVPKGDLRPWLPSGLAGGYGWEKNGHHLYFSTDSSYSVLKFIVKLKPHTN